MEWTLLMNAIVFQMLMAVITCGGSLCMNLGGRWKKYGVLAGLIAGPLWIGSLVAHAQYGMAFSSFWIWCTYFVGLWRVRFEMRMWLMRFTDPTNPAAALGECLARIKPENLVADIAWKRLVEMARYMREIVPHQPINAQVASGGAVKEDEPYIVGSRE